MKDMNVTDEERIKLIRKKRKIRERKDTMGEAQKEKEEEELKVNDSSWEKLRKLHVTDEETTELIVRKKEKGRSAMRGESSFVPEDEQEEKLEVKGILWEKLRKVGFMAAPMMVVGISQYLLQVVAMVMVGHLDELSLSGVALATSLTNVTGFSLLFGLAGALETLCGQAFGAEQYRKIGSFTYSSIICLLLFCFPISLLWVFMDKILILIHQNPQISKVACKYSIWLTPALFGYAILQSLVRYFQAQGMMLPLCSSSFATLCFHIPLCWVLVYQLKLGIIGAALSIGASYWLNVICLGIFMRYSAKCQKTRDLMLNDLVPSMKQFMGLAVPSAMMGCLEWWSFEILILLSGLLPNSKLETSVVSICLTTSAAHFFFVSAIGAAASTNVSNELGAGRPREAHAAVKISVFLGAIDAAIVSITLYSCRHIWGYIYSNERELVNYASEITLVLCFSMGVDSFLAVLSGIARGTGWVHIAAYANIVSYYIVGIPVGATLCFVLKMRGKGLWIGVLSGSTVQTLVLAVVTGLTDWQKEANKARERIFKTCQNPEREGEGTPGDIEM